MLLPFTFFVSSSDDASRSPLAESSLNILLTLIHYRKCILLKPAKDKNGDSASDSFLKEETCFSENPYCKALETARDIECETLYL